MISFTGLEHLENPVITPKTDYDNSYVELIRLNDELTEALLDLKAESHIHQEILTTAMNITNLRDTIEEKGISKALIAYADPNGELTAKFGFPALENLSDEPTNDAYAKVAVEGLSDIAQKVLDKITVVTKRIYEKTVKVFKSLKDVEYAISTYYKDNIKLIESLDIDNKKLKDLEIAVMSKTDFGKYIDNFEKVVANIKKATPIELLLNAKSTAEEIEEGVQKMIAEIKVDGLGTTANTRSIIFTPKDFKIDKASLGKHGYGTPKDITSAAGQFVSMFKKECSGNLMSIYSSFHTDVNKIPPETWAGDNFLKIRKRIKRTFSMARCIEVYIFAMTEHYRSAVWVATKHKPLLAVVKKAKAAKGKDK